MRRLTRALKAGDTAEALLIINKLDTSAILKLDTKFDETGDTPLTLSSGNGHLELVELLLNKGSDVNQIASKYRPLCAASWGGHLDVIILLLSHNADINIHSVSTFFKPLENMS